jgi:iron complex outermembrane recepter protein
MCLLACTAWTSLAATAAIAQETASTIETVTVTAQKRAENILDVPINVTALSAEEIQQARIQTPMDLASEVPSVDVKTNIPGAQEIITIRGVGLDDFSSTNNSTVGVYVDDIYLASFAEEDFNFFDLDRIEVLKGPQATLYGRNATAGAINIISAKPSFDALSGNLSATYGNYKDFQGDGMINVPVTDNFALRFAGETIQQGEGYWFSRVLDTDLGRQDIYLGRAQALWDPTSSISVLLKLEGEHNHSQIGVGKFFGTISTVPGETCPDFSNPAHCVDVHGYTDTTPNPFEGDWNHPAPYDIDRWSATLHVTDDLGWATLTSVTGYIGFRRSFYIDADATPYVDSEFDQNDKVNQFSQEIRLDGTGAGGLTWLAGADYAWDRVQSYDPGSLADLLGLDTIIQSDQTTHYAAGFGQVDWPLFDQVTLSSGVRLAYEDKHYVGGSSFFVSGTSIPFAPFDTFLADTIVNRSVDFRESLNWKPTTDSLVYASVSRGTKSGGFFNGISTNDAALVPYRPETLTDYEVGAKSSLFGDTLLIDSSAFYYDYRDLQAQTFTSVGAVALIKLSNIRTASIYGLDLGATWIPVDGLSLRGGLGLLHTRLGSFPYATATGPFTEPAGNRLPDAPDVTFNGTARYEHAVFDNYLGAVQMQAAFASDNFKEALNTPYLFTKANWVFDGRLSIATGDRGWELAFWMKNMFNEEHVVQATDDGTSDGYRIFNAPRTYGVTLTHAFE